jgi:hypothetical protein
METTWEKKEKKKKKLYGNQLDANLATILQSGQ